jgi:Sec-independent protein translocase protein TatA
MEFLGIGPTEFLMILTVSFIFLGPSRMMGLARKIGGLVRELRQAVNEIPALVALEDDSDEVDKGELTDSYRLDLEDEQHRGDKSSNG